MGLLTLVNILENASGGEYKWWEILTHIVPIWILFMVYPIKEFFHKSAHFAILTIYSQKLANFSLKSENLDNWKWKNGETFSLTLEKIIFCWQNIRLWHYDSDDLYQMHVENFILFVS